MPATTVSAIRTVSGETGRNDERFAEVMVEHDETVVKAGVAIGQFEVVDRAARELGLGEIFQVVAPATEAAAQRKRQVNLVQQFAARQQRVQNLPRVAELEMGSGVRGLDSGDFTPRAEGAERQERPCRDERIPRLGISMEMNRKIIRFFEGCVDGVLPTGKVR